MPIPLSIPTRMTMTRILPGTYLPIWLMKYARSPVAAGAWAPWSFRSMT